MGSYYITGDEEKMSEIRVVSGQISACRNNSFVVPVNNGVINPKMLTLYFAK